MQKKFGPKGFTVVSVSPDETAAEAGAFAKEIRATFPVLHDVSETVFNRFGVVALPANVVVDRRGRVVHTQEGGPIKKIEEAVAKALAAK